MTDREKAIVMAYTGKCMLTGDKFQIFHRYVEDIMGRPIWTHEIGLLEDEIKGKSEADFIALCADGNSSEKWIPVGERLPEKDGRYLAYIINSYDKRMQYLMTCDYYARFNRWCPDDETASDDVVAWMPLPEPYKESEG